MLESLFVAYFNSLASFWGAVFRVGPLQILLIVLLIVWLKRRRCGKWANSCCWSFGTDSSCWCGKECCRERSCSDGDGEEVAAEAEHHEADSSD